MYTENQSKALKLKLTHKWVPIRVHAGRGMYATRLTLTPRLWYRPIAWMKEKRHG